MVVHRGEKSKKRHLSMSLNRFSLENIRNWNLLYATTHPHSLFTSITMKVDKCSETGSVFRSMAIHYIYEMKIICSLQWHDYQWPLSVVAKS